MSNVLKRRIRYRRGWYTVLKRADWMTHKGTWLSYENHKSLYAAIKHLRKSKEFFE